MPEPGGAIEVRPVSGKADLERFIRLPWSIYRDDPHWVPPLLFERRQHLNPKSNPFYRNAEVQLWLAWREGRPVGRISAQVDRAALAQHRDGAGHFGLLEAVDDPAVFAALLQTAEDWLRGHGLSRVRGPFSLSINDETGLLIRGFDAPPYIMMNHARPYYAARVQAQGYRKARDMIAYSFHVGHKPVPSVVQPMIDRVLKRDAVTLRPLQRKNFSSELEAVLGIFNDAWSNNWGFVPFDAAMIAKVASELKPLIHDDMVWIAEVAGQPAAFALGLPNINEAITDLDGALLPFGWAKLLYRLKFGKIKGVRMPLMGVRKQYQNGTLGAALAYMVIGAVQEHTWRRGFQEAELSWVLEDNLRARKMIESAGGIPYKMYRVYDKALA